MCDVSHRFRPFLFQYKGAEILVHMLYFLSEQQTPLIGRRSFSSASFESLTFVLDFDGNDMMLAYSSLRL